MVSLFVARPGSIPVKAVVKTTKHRAGHANTVCLRQPLGLVLVLDWEW